jgi:hypothetical protein
MVNPRYSSKETEGIYADINFRFQQCMPSLAILWGIVYFPMKNELQLFVVVKLLHFAAHARHEKNNK